MTPFIAAIILFAVEGAYTSASRERTAAACWYSILYQGNVTAFVVAEIILAIVSSAVFIVLREPGASVAM